MNVHVECMTKNQNVTATGAEWADRKDVCGAKKQMINSTSTMRM